MGDRRVLPEGLEVKGPSDHLSWDELSCWNHQAKAFGKFQPGERIAVYPMLWRESRALSVAANFEEVRALLGGKPLTINSAYRTEDYNLLVAGAKMSQHVQGRAIDFTHPTLKPREVFALMRDAAAAGKLPLLGGLGSYRTFVHMDTRPRIGRRLAMWIY